MIKAHHHGLYLRTTRQPHRAARAVLPAVLASAGRERGVDTSRHLPYAEGDHRERMSASRLPAVLWPGRPGAGPMESAQRARMLVFCVWTKEPRAQRRGEGVYAFQSEDG